MVQNIKQTAASYNKRSAEYEEKWGSYLSHTYNKLLTILECEDGDRILDISAGTGLFAKYLIKKDVQFSEVVLNDISEEMLNIARSRFETNSLFSFAENPAEQLNFEDNSFDRVISLNAFHNYKKQKKVISEVRRVLKPGGKFYVLDWNRKGVFVLINYFIDLLSDEVIQTLNADEMKEKLESHDLKPVEQNEWRSYYWNFYIMVAQK